MKPVCKIPAWDLKNKRVLLRADLNVPLINGAIADDYRLRALIPTLQLIQKKGGIIVLATHIGRPKSPEPKLSTRLLIPWFAKQGFSVTFAETPEDAAHLGDPKNAPIVLLENLRFFSGEKNREPLFAQELAAVGDFYVNDAFGTMHRTDTSVTLVPALFAPERRSIGLLVERELQALDRLIITPKKPFIAVIGGGKVADKLPLLTRLLSKIDTLLLCPAIVFTFLKAQGKSVGKSLIDPTQLAACQKLLAMAAQKQVAIHLPLDYQIALDSISGPLSYVDADHLPANGIGISIGPKTIATYTEILKNAETIFFNAAMGFAFRPETCQGTNALIQALAQTQGFSVVGGGDSVAAVKKMGLETKIGYLSTGGGATIAYSSGALLQGLAALGDGAEAQ